MPSGVLYYVGSKTRVDVPFDDRPPRGTLAAIDLIRDLSSRDAPPEPLPPELRHRCFGCSLAPICLPEETLYPDPALRARARAAGTAFGVGEATPPGSRSPASSP